MEKDSRRKYRSLETVRNLSLTTPRPIRPAKKLFLRISPAEGIKALRAACADPTPTCNIYARLIGKTAAARLLLKGKKIAFPFKENAHFMKLMGLLAGLRSGEADPLMVRS